MIEIVVIVLMPSSLRGLLWGDPIEVTADPSAGVVVEAARAIGSRGRGR